MIGGKGDCFEDAFLSVTENAVLKQCSALVRPLLRSCNSDFFFLQIIHSTLSFYRVCTNDDSEVKTLYRMC